MSLEKTLTGNRQARLNPQYVMIAGIDDNDVPRFFKVTPEGSLTFSLGGIDLPAYDTILCAYWGDPGSHTNNLHTAIFKLDGTEVGRWTITYVNGAVANNDDVLLAVFTRP